MEYSDRLVEYSGWSVENRDRSVEYSERSVKYSDWSVEYSNRLVEYGNWSVKYSNRSVEYIGRCKTQCKINLKYDCHFLSYFERRSSFSILCSRIQWI